MISRDEIEKKTISDQLIADMKKACELYIKDYLIFRNQHENVANAFKIVLHDVETTINRLGNIHLYYETVLSLACSLQAVLLTKKSVKFKKYLDFIYSKYNLNAEIEKTNISNNYKKEINDVSDYLQAGYCSVLYTAKGISIFSEKYNKLHRQNTSSQNMTLEKDDHQVLQKFSRKN